MADKCDHCGTALPHQKWEAIEESARVLDVFAREADEVHDAHAAMWAEESARRIRALVTTPATPARLDPTGTAEPRTSLVGHARAGGHALGHDGRAAVLREVLDVVPQDICTHDGCDEGTCPLTRVNAAISALLDAQRGPATGRPHTYWHGSPCSCSWGADHGNGSPEQSEFAQRGPAPWVLACVRALETCGERETNPDTCGVCLAHHEECESDRVVTGYGCGDGIEGPACAGARARAALSLVPADVLAAARNETKGVE